MKIRFELSDDLYLLVDWKYITLPKKGVSIMLSDFIEKDESNLYYGFKSHKPEERFFVSANKSDRANLYPVERMVIEKRVEEISKKLTEHIEITSQPSFEKKDDDLIMVFKLNLVPKSISPR